MGKSIIIPGISAEVANLGQVELASVVDLTSDVQMITSTDSNKGAQYLHYPGGSLNDAFMRNTSIKGKVICYVDVSDFQGKRIVTYLNDTSASTDRSYMAFASAVNHTSNLSTDTAVQNAITAVERIVGTGTSGLVKREYTIPEGANYLVFSVYSENIDKIYIKVLQ